MLTHSTTDLLLLVTLPFLATVSNSKNPHQRHPLIISFSMVSTAIDWNHFVVFSIVVPFRQCIKR